MKQNKNFAQLIVLLAGIFLVGISLLATYEMFNGKIVSTFTSILAPFLAGFAIAFILYGPVKVLDSLFCRCKWKWVQRISRPVSVCIVYVLALALVALLLYAVLPAIIAVVTDFAKDLPGYSERVLANIQNLTAEGGLLANMGLENIMQTLYDNAEKFLNGMIEDFLSKEKMEGYINGIFKVTEVLGTWVLAFIVSVYMLMSKEGLLRSAKAMGGLIFKPKTMAFLSEFAHKTAKIFYRYLYSQMVDAVVVAVLATIGFLLARLPNAPVLGIMLGLMNLIPYFGALIGGVACVLVALLTGNFYGALFVAVYILVMQQIDANIIQPRIVGQSVGLRPLYVLFGITVGGGLFGFWGILLGAPVMAVLHMLVSDYIATQKAKDEPLIPIEEAETTSEE